MTLYIMSKMFVTTIFSYSDSVYKDVVLGAIALVFCPGLGWPGLSTADNYLAFHLNWEDRVLFWRGQQEHSLKSDFFGVCTAKYFVMCCYNAGIDQDD